MTPQAIHAETVALRGRGPEKRSARRSRRCNRRCSAYTFSVYVQRHV